MPKFHCPRCKQPTLSMKDKYLIGWWKTANCGGCGARITAYPILLMIYSFLYVWNIIWWVGMAQFNDSLHYLIYMAVIWLLLDFFNIQLIPLAAMKDKAKPSEEPKAD